MSFGFLTESALLPSKSKPIKVDGRSLVDLKAVVYAKEQKVKLDGGGSSAGLRGLRGKRAAAGSHADGPARKDPFARSNRGVEDRSQRDELDRVTASQKRKAAQRTMAAKASLYEKMAKGVVGGSQSGSLVDFSRKTGADLALLEAKAGKSKRRPGSSKTNGKKRQQRNGVGSSRKRGKTDSRDSDTDDQAENDDDDYDDGTSAEITITDEFGRDRAVSRGGLEHRAYLEAKKAAAESRAEEKAQIESFDERYSYRGNGGSTAPHNATSSSSFASFSSGGGTSSLSGGRPGAGATAAAAATSTAATTNAGGGWAWSSGVGRGADAGDFETREGQERRAKDGLAELLQREGGGAGAGGSEVGKDGGGAKILSQWERTLTGDQKTFLREVQEETAISRSAPTDRNKQRLERKALLRQKQEARAARLRGEL